MAIALVDHKTASASAGSTATTAAMDTTGASLLVICASNFASTSYTVSDSKSNTWTALTNRVGGSSNSKIFYVVNPTVGTGHTFGVAGSYVAIGGSAWSGVSTSSPFDQQNGAGNAASTTTIQPGSITPGVNDELVISCAANRINSAFTVSLLTLLDTVVFAAGINMGLGVGYEIQTTATARNPTFTSASSADMSAAIASFKAASAGGVVIPIFMNFYRQRRAS